MRSGASPGGIITLQFGHYANFVGAHFWNLQACPPPSAWSRHCPGVPVQHPFWHTTGLCTRCPTSTLLVTNLDELRGFLAAGRDFRVSGGSSARASSLGGAVRQVVHTLATAKATADHCRPQRMLWRCAPASGTGHACSHLIISAIVPTSLSHACNDSVAGCAPAHALARRVQVCASKHLWRLWACCSGKEVLLCIARSRCSQVSSTGC
jgi:Misato Segment II tubulin-like domain